MAIQISGGIQLGGGINLAGWNPYVAPTGALWSWGRNNYGQVGNGATAISVVSPVTTTAGGTTWSQISCAYSTTAIKTDGTLWTCGAGAQGGLGNGSTANISSFVTVAGGGTTWKQVSTGQFGAAAVKTDGTLWTWGYNNFGQLGNNSLANTSSPNTTAGGGTTWSQVSCGYGSAAVKTDGTLWTWGWNAKAQLGDGTSINRSSPNTTVNGGTTWSRVSTGIFHMVAIKTDGTVWTCGYNAQGQLGNGSTLASTTGQSSFGTTAGGGTNWSSVVAGYYGSAGIKTDGTLWTWGTNQNAALGDGTTTNRSSPVTVAGGGTTWSQVAVGGSYYSAAIKTDGTLWTWGLDNYGQLGNGTTLLGGTGQSSPNTVVGSGTTWSSVACGSAFTVGIR